MWFDGDVSPELLTIGPDEPTRLVVHLPGWGDRALVHLDLLARLADAETAVVVVEPIRTNGRSPRWYDVDDDGPRVDEVAEAIAAVRGVLDDLVARHRLTHDDVTLIGFSQGGALALAIASCTDGGPTPGAVASLAGYLLARDEFDGSRLVGLPALVAHGVDDEMVETLRGRAAAKALHRSDAVVQWTEVDGGHVLDGPLLDAATEWLGALARGVTPSTPPA